MKVIKPVKGIENCKFRPIVRTMDNVKIDLDYIDIKPINKKVAQMIKEIQPKSLNININQGG